MKSNPIGVRFDPEMLELMKKEGIATSPQKALNCLTDIWWGRRKPDEAIKAGNEEREAKEMEEAKAQKIKEIKPAPTKTGTEPKEGSMAWYLKNAPKEEKK